MKKILLFLAIIVSVPAYSSRYLVQLGTTGAAAWTDPTASGGTLVDLTVSATSLNTWYNGITFIAGDEVWVAAGNFVTTGVINLKDGVNVYGGFAGTETAVSQRAKGTNGWDFINATVIDANNGNYVAINTSTTFAVASVFDGFSITKCAKTATTGNGGFGSAIGTITIQSCKFFDNTFTRSSGTTTMSGGLFIRTGAAVLNSYFFNNQMLGDGTGIRGGAMALAGNVTVKGCTFENNYGVNGGGAVNIMSNTATNSVGGNFEDCIFKNNNGGTGSGGAVYILGSQMHSANTVFKNCQFIGNQASAAGALHHGGSTGGGGTYTSNFSMEGCVFANNTSNTGQGAVVIAPAGVPTMNHIKNSIFRGNKNATAGQNGAALSVSNKAFPVYNCVFTNNSGLNTVYQNIADMEFYNCTFANNASEAGGGSLQINSALASTFKNNIFWGNSQANVIPGTGTLTTGNNAFDDDESAQPWYGTGSINSLTSGNTFASPTTFIGAPANETEKTQSDAADWKLKSGCPAIDAGTAIAMVTTDILGITRPVGSAYDIGAYEGESTPTAMRRVEKPAIKVYPSVTEGMVNIESGSAKNTIILMDINGRKAGQWSNTSRIDISSGRPGVYMLIIRDANNYVSTFKIIKK